MAEMTDTASLRLALPLVGLTDTLLELTAGLDVTFDALPATSTHFHKTARIEFTGPAPAIMMILVRHVWLKTRQVDGT